MEEILNVIVDETGTESEERIQQRINRNSIGLMRFFSIDSEMNITPVQQEAPVFPDSICNREFAFKLLELSIGCTCAGLYSEAIQIMRDDKISSMCFPNVVFSSFIIITSVIAISYVLGYKMSDVLIRIFNSLAMILYFISATVTFHAWVTKFDLPHTLPKKLLITQSLLSYINVIVYGTDMFISVKKAATFEEIYTFSKR